MYRCKVCMSGRVGACMCVCVLFVCLFFSFVTCVAVHEKTRFKTQFVILHNARIKVKSLFYFLLKANLSNDNKSKSV